MKEPPSPGSPAPIPSEGVGMGLFWEPPKPEELQERLPRFEILELLRPGVMGAVYKARQKSLGRLVAIKVLPPGLDDGDARYAKLFKQEALTMARLQHPGIVSVYDAGETPCGLFYVIMEFMEGTEVAQMIQSQGRLPMERALAITAHVCDALQYAHGCGVIHRDIKPGNIMVDPDGRVKVADFGLATANEQVQRVSSIHQMPMGTADYVAPEVFIPGVTADHRVDLYAVGVMLYAMLTGEVPRGRFPLPSELVAADPRLDAIVVRAMQTDRERRYQSALEIRQDLDQILTTPGQGIPASLTKAPSALPLAPARRKPLNWWLTPVVGAAVALLGIGGFLLRNGTATLSPQSATKEQPFVNSLGMKFVPVPGTGVLFCIHDTRKGDYREYAEADGSVTRQWDHLNEYGVPVSDGEEHPVVMMTREDAEGFCAWLSRKEVRKYRLPTDHEWSCAVGIGNREDIQDSPAIKNHDLRDVYPWGRHWPPPSGAGNFADTTLKERIPSWPKETMESYKDGYATTSPVMSFVPNPFGLYDMSGNVWQWCADNFDPAGDKGVMRGGSWRESVRTGLLSSYRLSPLPTFRLKDYGFRIVLER